MSKSYPNFNVKLEEHILIMRYISDFHVVTILF
jgi:hypothetical protein